jgi:peroxiredoxin family protein
VSGFVFSGGVYTSVTVPCEVLTQLLGINDKGDIVGFYKDAAGLAGSFLATP